MTAVRKTQAGKGFVVERIPVPSIGPDQVLVRVEAASVCGTDLHVWNWDAWASSFVNKLPLTMGHEFAGEVVEVGQEVKTVKMGDYVSAESQVSCGACALCRAGEIHLCSRLETLGLNIDGAFAEYLAVPEKVVWQNDRNKLPPEIATLQEPFGTSVYGASEQSLAGKSVCVLGCGPIGLFCVAIARAYGASKVLAVETQSYRVELARKMGPDAIFQPPDGGAAKDTAEWMIENTEGLGADVVLEASGAGQPVIDTALWGVRRGGRVILLGIPARPVEVNVADDLLFKNITLLALAGRRIFDSWYRTRGLLESGAVSLRPLITHEMPLEDIDVAIGLLRSGKAGKIILRPHRGR
jgi:threonine 3-dehydrogenase